MAWNPAIPATNADLLSAPVRDNFGALDTALMAALATLANGQVLTKAAGPILAGVPTGTDGHVLTLSARAPRDAGEWASAHQSRRAHTGRRPDRHGRPRAHALGRRADLGGTVRVEQSNHH